MTSAAISVARSTPRARYGLFCLRKIKKAARFKIAPSVIKLPNVSFLIDADSVSIKDSPVTDSIENTITQIMKPKVLATSPMAKPSPISFLII